MRETCGSGIGGWMREKDLYEDKIHFCDPVSHKMAREKKLSLLHAFLTSTIQYTLYSIGLVADDQQHI